MKAQLARSVIGIVGLAGALVIFMTKGDDLMPLAASIGVALAGFFIAEGVFRRMADFETKRRDLEERTRDNLS